MLGILHILVLNDLSDAPHNLFIKCFASRHKEKERSLKKLFDSSWKQLSASLLHILMGIRSIYASAQKGEDIMKYELTPERVMEIGKGFEDAYLTCLPINKRLKGLKPEDIFARFKPEDIFARFKPEERIAGLKPEDILASLSDEDIMAYINKKGKGVKAKR